MIGSSRSDLTMPDTPIHVLLIEGNPADERLISNLLAGSTGARFEMTTAPRLEAGLECLRNDRFDLVILDVALSGCTPEQALARLASAAIRLPIVVLGEIDHEPLSREIIKLGAQDYLVKPLNRGVLVRSLLSAIERKRIEAGIVCARDDALEAVAMKSAFLANMSHEIRTPMNAIVGMTRMLLDTTLDSDQREFGEVVWSSAHALLRIINDILDFSKVSAGKLRLEEIDFSPAETLESVIGLFSEQVQRTGIELATFVDSEVPPRLRGDPVRLRQVLVNLIGNAIKFTEAGGVAVTVECAGASSVDAILRFSVRDTGPGIPAEAQKSLFRAFYQADGSTTRRHGGTGLGLAISAEIVARMGGEIGVESAPARGCNFWFTARFMLGADDAESIAAPMTNLRGRSVLLCAPDSLGARFLSRQLNSWGVRCELATTSAQTLAIVSGAVSGADMDAIVIDCNMAGMEGLALARQLSAHARFAGIPMVGICHLGERPDGPAMRSAGMLAALVKPVRQSELSSWLNTAIACSPEHPQAELAAAPRRQIQLKPFREIAQSFPHAAPERARILLVEDHPVNRRVALKMLERLGCRAESVTNGREALDALARTAYNIVLMDCQMPEMDGYEATREIRRLGGGTAKIAIIGLTAHALAGDRQKCLDAGMDDYLSKPFLPEDLAAMLSRWLPGGVAAPSETAQHEIAGDTIDIEPPAVDPAALRSLESAADDGPEFLRQLITVFLSDLGDRVAAMRSGVGAGDPTSVAYAAHALKGSCGHFGAKRLLALCRELEAQARAGSTDGPITAIIDSIELECARVRIELETHLIPVTAG
jgi:two-component system, sensor histidine kinase and response regulator